MIAYLSKRVLSTVPVLVVVGFFVFGLLHLAPGDPAATIAGDQASSADIAHIRQNLGLDQPFWTQFAMWIVHILHGNFGQSLFSGEPVLTLIGQSIGPTVSLAVLTVLVSVLIAVPLGVLAAVKASSWMDRFVMAGSVMGYSVPLFVVAYVLAYVFSLKLHWLPVQGYASLSAGVWPWLSHLIMPSLALGAVYVALIARITRSSILDVFRQDYIRTARAKGLPAVPILFIHALKNAGIPIITIVGIGFGSLLSGTIVTEAVFAIPGLGHLTIDAVLRRDYPVIQGLVLVFSASYVLVNLLIDLTYGLFDPRIRY